MTQSLDPLWIRLLPAAMRRKLSGQSNLLSIIHNSGWLLFDRFIRMALGLLVGAWVARYLGPGQYGELAYALAYIAFFSAIANLGMDGVVVRDIARNKSAAPHILGTAFVIRLVVGIVCWFCAIAGMAFIADDLRDVWLVALAGGSLVFQAADTIDLWFQSQSQNRRTVVAKLISYLISNGLKVLLIFMKAPLLAFAAVMALDAMAAAIGLVVAYRRFPVEKPWRYIAGEYRGLIKESWPFMLSGLAIIIYMRIDQIMLKAMLGAKELGIYAAAIPLSQVWHVIPMALYVSLAPYVAKKKLESHSAYMETLLLIFRLFLVAGLMISVVMAMLSGIIVHLLYGDPFRATTGVLSIHIFSNVFVFLGVAQSLWLVNEGRSGLALTKAVIGSIASLIGNFVLIPLYGVRGAAMTSIFSYALSAVFSNMIYAPQIFMMQLGLAPRNSK